MDPETNAVKYIYMPYECKIEFVYYESRADLDMENMESIHQVMTYAMSPSYVLEMVPPETISKTIAFADIERCNADQHRMWNGHDTEESAAARKSWLNESWITGEPFVRPW